MVWMCFKFIFCFLDNVEVLDKWSGYWNFNLIQNIKFQMITIQSPMLILQIVHVDIFFDISVPHYDFIVHWLKKYQNIIILGKVDSISFKINI